MLSGQPRRIPDYPDAFKGWNEVSSYGSMVSVLSTIIFGVALYRSFASEKTINNINWSLTNYWTPTPVATSAISVQKYSASYKPFRSNQKRFYPQDEWAKLNGGGRRKDEGKMEPMVQYIIQPPIKPANLHF